MMKIYTPEAWLSLFGGSPSLVIDDNGYIYSADGYYKMISDSPIGKIDYAKGYIYDQHYTDMFPTPIAEMVTKDDVTEVYQYGGGILRTPILYIKNEKIYTPDEYLRIFGGNASGYIQRGNGSGGNSTSGSGCLGELGVFAVIIGVFLLLSCIDEIRQKGASFYITFVILAGLMFFGRYHRKKRAQEKSASAPKPAQTFNPTPKTAPQSAYKPKSAPKSNPQPWQNTVTPPKSNPQPQSSGTKIGSCPYCAAKVRVPLGKGRIRITCPNPACGQRFEIDT